MRVDRHAHFRRQPDRAQHAHRILAEPGHRRPDQLQPPRTHVGDAADVVPDFLRDRIEVERVDGEVAARGVFRLRAVDIVRQQAPVLVGRHLGSLRRAERRDLEHLGADMHVHETEPAADDVGAPEQRLHLFGRRVGRDVEVFRRQPQQQVAHRAADDERLESRLVQFSVTMRAPRGT